MSPAELAKGGNAILGPVGGLESLVVGTSWTARDAEWDLCALLCGPERKVLDDEHFLFWNNTSAPGGAASLRWQREPVDAARDRAQLLVALADLAPSVERIVVCLATIAAGATLSGVSALRARTLDPRTGADLAVIALPDTEGPESCLLLTEVYRHGGNWKQRAIAQGYASGLAGLSSDYGVNVG